MERDKTVRRIVLTGGGSTGHVSPMLAVADALRERNEPVELLYVGVKQGMEAVVVPRTDIPIRYAPSTGLPASKLSPGMARWMFTLLRGILKAMFILLRFRPHAILAAGGFASAPSVFAATAWRILTLGIWRIPVYLHEQNAIPGRMNQLAGRFATRIGLAHAAAAATLPPSLCETVGYPVRGGFRQVSREQARQQLGLPEDAHYVVVFGGSQGARTINRALVDALPRLAERKNLRIIHAAGKMNSAQYHAMQDTEARLQQLDRTPEHYTLHEYLHDLPVHLAAADLAVIRAGAGSLLEISALGVPAVVIPKANLPGDSQVANAREWAAKGAVEIMYEEPAVTQDGLIETVHGHRLAERILALLDEPAARRSLSDNARATFDPDAAARVADRLMTLAEGRDPAPMPQEKTSQPPPPPSPSVLRRDIESKLGFAWEQAFQVGRVSDEGLERLEDLSYLRYRGAALLVHPAWLMRNEGIKLLGLTRHEERLGLLVYIVTDRTPASALHRRLGGDYRQVGFLRRNAMAAFALIGQWNDEIRRAVLAGLNDPYYEVRSWTCRFLRSLRTQAFLEDEQIIRGVRSLTDDHSVEVRAEALHTFGQIGAPDDVLEVTRPLLLDFHVPLRMGVLRAFEELEARYPGENRAHWKKLLATELDDFLITSVSVHPDFPLKREYAKLRAMMNGETKQ
ncbi:hypothetical protein GF324_09830 [bacterium]|nr:hypothetical protein [bacterium]